jgi:hypothetical protein
LKIERFEDIQAWQEARSLTNLIYSICKKNLFSKDYGLRDQMQRASVIIQKGLPQKFNPICIQL